MKLYYMSKKMVVNDKDFDPSNSFKYLLTNKSVYWDNIIVSINLWNQYRDKLNKWQKKVIRMTATWNRKIKTQGTQKETTKTEGFKVWKVRVGQLESSE